MEASELKRIKELEEENARLIMMIYQPRQGARCNKIYHRTKVIKRSDKCSIVNDRRTERPKDIGKACRILIISRSSLLYQSVKNDE